MIELLLQAERALSAGLVEQADRLYRQAAEADPRNSIAVVGLARVALERADDAEAWRQARRALSIDPENVAAQRLVERLEEVFAHRGEPLPEPAAEGGPAAEAMGSAGTEPAAEAAPAETAPPAAATPRPSTVEPRPEPSPALPRPAAPAGSPAAGPARRSILDRVLRRNRS